MQRQQIIYLDSELNLTFSDHYLKLTQLKLINNIQMRNLTSLTLSHPNMMYPTKRNLKQVYSSNDNQAYLLSSKNFKLTFSQPSGGSRAKNLLILGDAPNFPGS